MKAILLVNLKHDGGIAVAGSVCEEPFPDYIANNIDNEAIVKLEKPPCLTEPKEVKPKVLKRKIKE